MCVCCVPCRCADGPDPTDYFCGLLRQSLTHSLSRTHSLSLTAIDLPTTLSSINPSIHPSSNTLQPSPRSPPPSVRPSPPTSELTRVWTASHRCCDAAMSDWLIDRSLLVRCAAVLLWLLWLLWWSSWRVMCCGWLVTCCCCCMKKEGRACQHNNQPNQQQQHTTAQTPSRGCERGERRQAAVCAWGFGR